MSLQLQRECRYLDWWSVMTDEGVSKSTERKHKNQSP